MAVPKVINTWAGVAVIACAIGAGSVGALIIHGGVMGSGQVVGVLKTELPNLPTYIDQGSSLAGTPTTPPAA